MPWDPDSGMQVYCLKALIVLTVIVFALVIHQEWK